MRKFFGIVLLVALAVILIGFAVGNRHLVAVSFDPYVSSDPSFGVTLPLFLVIILSVAIFDFALSWNDFTFAFILQTDRHMFTLPVGLATFVEQTAIHWGMVMASAVLVSVPTFALVFFLQKYLLSGLGMSAK